MGALAIERRSGWGDGAPPMSARPIKRLQPWNKGLLVGQKKPLEPKHVWSTRVRLELAIKAQPCSVQSSNRFPTYSRLLLCRARKKLTFRRR